MNLLLLIILIISYIYLLSSSLIISKSQWSSLVPRLFSSLAGKDCVECGLTQETFATFSSFLGISNPRELFKDLDLSFDGKLSWEELTAQEPFSHIMY